jgi:Spy/CpxP family protein refolding chaperone
MSTRYFFKSSLGALAFMLTVGASQAQPVNPPDRDKMMERHVTRMADEVKATPEQKAKLLAIAKAAHADIQPLHEQVKRRMDQARAESQDVLTPEQRKVWEAKMKSMQERMGARMRHKHD